MLKLYSRIIQVVNNVDMMSVYFVLLYLSLCFNVGYTFSDFKLDRIKRNLNCTDTQFLCKIGQCINESLVCDGIKDCPDSSDENEEQCHRMNCPSYSFRCAYGACIDSAGKCNGKLDCVDKSDELPSICSVDIAEINNATCEENELQCSNRKQCVNIDFICDGSKDCEDGSDETYYLCKNAPCDKRFFRCDYGACIDIAYRCDGIKQCVDGSDESVRTCNNNKRKNGTERQTTTPSSSSNEFCVAPSPLHDKSVKYKCYGESAKNCHTDGDKLIRQFAVATFECNPGYSREEGNKFHSACLESEWQPPIANCNKICDKLTPLNVDLKCYRNATSVSCDGNLIAGTVVRPTCKQSHIYKDFVPVYEEIVCEEDGKWDNILFPCIPSTSSYYLIYVNIAILYVISLVLFFYIRGKFSNTQNTKM